MSRSENDQRHLSIGATYLLVMLDRNACYRALAARDARFDGVFFVGVKTTGIYCRPVCTARVPGRDRCVFYHRAAEAERDGYRACFRCRPELAPGLAPVDAVPRLAEMGAARIEAGALDEGSVDDLATELGVTSRHLRRAFDRELGVSPIELAEARRLALAKRLLTDTNMRVTDIAFASGFSSLRRFNAVVKQKWKRSPSAMRPHAKSAQKRASDEHDAIVLRLDYRPPFDWPAWLAFAGARCIPSIEAVRGDTYLTTVREGDAIGWLTIAPDPKRSALVARVSPSLTSVVGRVVHRLNRALDLDARPDLVRAALSRDRAIGASARKNPGIRLPGALDGFSAAVRAILGQQVTVRAATTLATRLSADLGEPITTPFEELSRVFPDPRRLSRAGSKKLASMGILPARAACIEKIAVAADAGTLRFDAASAGDFVTRFSEIPGVGDWTAQWVAMRALAWPDAFPSGDLALQSVLHVDARELKTRAEAWRPWRAYGAMHLWSMHRERNVR